MNFEKYSSRIITSLLPDLKEIGAYEMLKDNNSFHKTFDSLLRLLYTEINDSILFLNSNMDKKIRDPVLMTDIKQPTMSSSKFYPSVIKDYIDNTIKYQLVYTLHIRGSINKVYFSIFTERDILKIEKYNKYIEFIYSWLYICHKFSLEGSCKTMDIFLHLTPFTKKLPQQQGVTIDAEHVNTGFTRRCSTNNEIILYRKEEWKKVFIHETFHSFCFDMDDTQQDSIKPFIRDLFPVNSSFLISETYVETWARILNSAYESYFSLENVNDCDTFLVYMKFSLQIERIHAMRQMCKILEFMGLSYYDIVKDDKKNSKDIKKSLYNENTNVFAYYILTAVFLNNYFYFLVWCAKNNSNIFSFSKSPIATTKFKEFITTQLLDPTLRKTIDYICTKKEKKGKKRKKG